MSHTGTIRGAPKNRKPEPPHITHSPSGIPRPALDTHASQVAQSDASTSLSASRAKMSKRDDVSLPPGCPTAASPPQPAAHHGNRLFDARLRPT